MARTRSNKTTPPPKPPRRRIAAKTVRTTQRSVKVPNMATEHATVLTTTANSNDSEGSEHLAQSTSTSAIVDPLSTADNSGSTTSSAHASPTSAADTPDALAIANESPSAEIAKILSTSTPPTSVTTTAIVELPTIANGFVPESSTNAATVISSAMGSIGSTIAETSPQPSIGAESDTAATPSAVDTETIAAAGRRASLSLSEMNTAMQKTTRSRNSRIRSGEYGRTFSSQPFITNPNTQDDPIVLNDESYDARPPCTIKQVLQYRRYRVEEIDSLLESLTSCIRSTADADQSGDYGGKTTGEKRLFQDFVDDELDGSDEWKSLATSLAYEIAEYQGMLRSTKEFRCS